MDQPNFFAVIPASVRYDNRLKANAKLLYGEITALCNREGFCWAGNDYFADLYEVDPKTISRWISQLSDCGFLDVEVLKSEGNKRKITIDKKVTTYGQKSHEVVTKKSLASDKKVTSNIRINNTINNTNNREENASDFLANNYPSRYETFLMQYKTKIGADFEKLIADFNCKIVEEKKEWEQDILFARLTRLANNWISRGNDFQKKHQDVIPAGPKRVLFTSKNQA